jgi:DNA mismatch repair ATPase MutS
LLKEIYDIERLSYLIQFKQNSPFHWLKIKITLNAIYEISQIDDKFIKLSDELQQLRKILNE